MKIYIVALGILASFGLSAQGDEKMPVQKTIEDFFVGFHAQDSLKIKETVSDKIIMQRISISEAGEMRHRNSNFGRFLKGIVSIPKDKRFEEKIKSINIQVDGPMANAWTDYEFWIDGALHHCGVNSFQLFNDGNGWKIIYIIDTGRTEGCE